MNPINMLSSLANDGWTVALNGEQSESGETVWVLRIEQGDSSFLYRGPLERVIARAWAGEKGDA